MKLKAFWLCGLMSTAALAGTDAGGFGGGGEDHAEMKAEREAQVAQSIKDALGVDASGAAKVDQALAATQTQRQSLHQDMKQNLHVIKAAAEGDAKSQAGLAQAMQKVRADHTQMQQLHQQLFDQLAQGRTPAQQAKLFLAMTHGKHHHGGWGRGHHGAPPAPQQ